MPLILAALVYEALLVASKSGGFNVGVPSTTGFDRSLLVGSDFQLPEPARSATLGSKPPGIRWMSAEARLSAPA